MKDTTWIIAGALLCLQGWLVGTTQAQTLVLFEDFEDNTVNFTASEGLFNDGASDYFTIVPLNGAANPDAAYTGFNGSSHFAAEDMDDGATRSGTQTLFFTSNITNFENLTFNVLFAAGGNGASVPAYDDEESFLVRASIDGGAIQNLLAFEALEPGGDPTNNRLAQDTDFDGVGDGFEPTSAFAAYNGLTIAGTGNSLLLEIIVTSTDGNSEFAFDDVSITGTPVAVPEPGSAFAMLLLGAAVVLYRRRS